MIRYAEVVLPLPLDRAFTYSVSPEHADKLCLGMRVLVPFGERMLTGFVVATRNRRRVGDLRLKPVAEVLDESPIFSPVLLSFTRKLSRHFFCPWGEILQAAVPPSFILRTRPAVSLTAKGREALDKSLLSDEEKDVASWLKQKPYTLKFLQKKTRMKKLSAVVARLEKKEFVLVRREIKRVRRKARTEPEARPTQLELDFTLDEPSRRVAESIASSIARKPFSRFLLYGSRLRREAVYFDLIRRTRSAGGRILFLIPEISLTPGLLDKLEKRIGEAAAVLHSEMTERRRELEWRKIRENRAEVVVGPRSALFSPVENVRLIIVDEEQDESYSQQESVPYDVRAGAWLRAREEKAALILGSSAPTVEAFYRAEKGRHLIELGTEARKANVTLVDSCKAGGIIYRPLALKIKEQLDHHQPVLLFFNRRGYASYLQCARCAYVPQCVRCDLALSYHKKEGKLVCHYCRYSSPLVDKCPRCGSRLVGKKGAGIEAVAEELRKNFPNHRVEIFAADEAGRREDKARIVREFIQGQIDLLAGTELLAYQANFPPVSLVAVLHPELMLNLADFRSGEKTFQSLVRDLSFLRDDEKAEALIQTDSPEHFSIREAAHGDYRAFYGQEIKYRRLMNYPPFSCLAEVFFLGENLRRVAEQSRKFAERMRNTREAVKIFGPALASVSKKRGLHRVQVSLRARKKSSLDRVLTSALKGIKAKTSIFFFGGEH